MCLASCLHCMPWQDKALSGGEWLHLRVFAVLVALLGSVFSCCWDKLTSQIIDAFQVQGSKVSCKHSCTLHLHESLFGCLETSINRVLSLIWLFYSMVICTFCLSSTSQGVMMSVLCWRTFKVEANPLFCSEMNQMSSTDPLLGWDTCWVIILPQLQIQILGSCELDLLKCCRKVIFKGAFFTHALSLCRVVSVQSPEIWHPTLMKDLTFGLPPPLPGHRAWQPSANPRAQWWHVEQKGVPRDLTGHSP